MEERKLHFVVNCVNPNASLGRILASPGATGNWAPSVLKRDISIDTVPRHPPPSPPPSVPALGYVARPEIPRIATLHAKFGPSVLDVHMRII